MLPKTENNANRHENHYEIIRGKSVCSIGLHGVEVAIGVDDSSNHSNSDQINCNEFRWIGK